MKFSYCGMFSSSDHPSTIHALVTAISKLPPRTHTWHCTPKISKRANRFQVVPSHKISSGHLTIFWCGFNFSDAGRVLSSRLPTLQIFGFRTLWVVNPAVPSMVWKKLYQLQGSINDSCRSIFIDVLLRLGILGKHMKLFFCICEYVSDSSEDQALSTVCQKNNSGNIPSLDAHVFRRSFLLHQIIPTAACPRIFVQEVAKLWRWHHVELSRHANLWHPML